MKKFFSFALALLAVSTLTIGLTGCKVEVDKEGPIEDAVEEVTDGD